jgi:hypothetical protein
MHDIEPYFKWRDYYIASEDKKSPFFGRDYSEFHFTNKVYNYYIHPQWDEFGSNTLYMKVLYVNYREGVAILEFIGEWNDCLYNDIMYLKRDIIDQMVERGIYRYILLCDNVMNFHGSDDSYYEEWWDDVKDDGGWIAMVNVFDHVEQELKRTRLQYYVNFGYQFNEVNWQRKKPDDAIEEVHSLLQNQTRSLNY